MLARRIEENPATIDTLELWELVAINHYYDEIIRKNEDELAYLRNTAT